MDRALEMFERAIDADPNHANTLGNFALFLKNVRKDMDRAQEMYERAIATDPSHADILDSYAIFLTNVRQDFPRALELYDRAIELDPKEANCVANSAHCLLAMERLEEGLEKLRAAFSMKPKHPTLQLELNYYALVHDAQSYPEALGRIKELITQGVRSAGWNLQLHVDLAAKRNDPRVPLLDALAQVITAGADPATLDAFPAWTNA
ncbi:tetratricopeptide repeat protein [Magnetofaba australis]|uniref:tetratricopeptide repeat protein n=1 Tax=Magnetofaba australis TaxID=1472297 RepID=UPI001301D256|nr:tetratricopeptide repeat protein [Magnetofaba australis]